MFLGHYKHRCYMLCLVLYCQIGHGGMDLLKLVDNRIKACFLGKCTHWRQPVLEICRGIQLSEGIEQCDIKLT